MRDAERLDRLCLWAEERGWHVEFETPTGVERSLPMSARHIDEMNPQTRIISLDATQSQRSAVYALLHELGHVLEDERGGRFFSATYGTRSRVGRLTTIEVELSAWAFGWNLGERLQLGLNRAAFERESAKWLMRYVTRGGLPADA